MELVIEKSSLDKARRRLREKIEEHGSQLAFAEAYKLNHSLVSQALRGRIDPPPALLAALGLRRVVRYEEKRRK